MRTLVLILILVFVTLGARADFMPYAKLYRACAAKPGMAKEALAWGQCHGYLAALADSFTQGGSVHGYRACLPPKVTMKRVWKEVHEWMRDHPGNLVSNASVQVARAMSEIFPCPPTADPPPEVIR